LLYLSFNASLLFHHLQTTLTLTLPHHRPPNSAAAGTKIFYDAATFPALPTFQERSFADESVSTAEREIGTDAR
jgi:hypothetical protein